MHRKEVNEGLGTHLLSHFLRTLLQAQENFCAQAMSNLCYSFNFPKIQRLERNLEKSLFFLFFVLLSWKVMSQENE